MSHRVMLFLVMCVVICSGLQAAEDGLVPGRHKKLPVDNGSWTWDVFIPSSYAGFDGAAFPVLYLSSPTGGPGPLIYITGQNNAGL